MTNLLDNLNKEQAQAVTHGSGPLLIVAGAGTGKTTVITRRIAYLIEQNLAKPDEILALTFTEKAAGEMQERLDLLLPLGYHDMWISTFHSFCQRILERHGLDIGLPGDFKLLDDTQGWVMVHNNLEQFQLDYYRPMGNPKKFISALLKHFSRCKDELITPENYLNYAQELKLATDTPEGLKINRENSEMPATKKPKKSKTSGQSDAPPAPADPVEAGRIEEIANAFFVYQKLLLDSNRLDFGDLIGYALQLFNKRPKILNFYQKKFKYLLVDEFQDTNFAQYQLVKLLAGQDQNLTVVGDDDQSIYKFRGASVSNILKFQEEFLSLKQVTLNQNYRSGQKILDLAYNFIQANNPDRLEVKLKINKRLKSSGPVKGEVEVLEGKDQIEELHQVAQKVNALKTQDPTLSWNDFAVLLRSNSAAAELLPILAKHGIPHNFVANTGLYKKPLIANLIAYLSCLNNFHDSFALYRVLGFKQFSLQPKDVSTLLINAEKKTLSLYETLVGAPALPALGQAAQRSIEKILGLMHGHAKLAQERAANETFVAVVNDLNLKDDLEEETLENAENRELLEQFYKKIESFVADNSDKSLHNFLHSLNLEMEAGDEGQIKFDPNQGPESLKVLTVHSAKGLEFAHVFIPNLVDQRFPTRARNDQIEIPVPLIKDILPEGDFHLQEERRLFYVALTRAKTGLHLSWAKDYGGAKTKKPSIFLQETKLVPSNISSQATGKVFFPGPTKTNQVYQILPQTFSFSALKAFETCPLQYKFQYYLKLPGPGSAYFSFGQTIHKVFELYLKDYRARKGQSQQDLFGKMPGQAEIGTLEFLEELYEKYWIDEWYKDKKQKLDYRQKGKQLLKIFYEHTKHHSCDPKYLEQSFYLPLGEYKFTGKIDRADTAATGLQIVDYKTSEKIPAKNEKNDLDQLHVYQWAAEEFLGEKVSGLSYWYLQDNKFLNEDPAGQADIDKLKHRLLESIEKIIHTVKYDLFNEEHAKTKKHPCAFERLG
ncbi:MAG: ATP-dependent helicase [Patescibacteria group bacterium]|nr:ATP-dependent helicase [Patescibacteria group bacterium]